MRNGDRVRIIAGKGKTGDEPSIEDRKIGRDT